MSIIDEIRIDYKCASNGYYIRWYDEGWHYLFAKSSSEIYTTSGELYKTSGISSIDVGCNVKTDSIDAISRIITSKQLEVYTSLGWVEGIVRADTWRIGRGGQSIVPVSFSIDICFDGATSPILSVEVIEYIYWINHENKYMVNHNGNRIVFKHPA